MDTIVETGCLRNIGAMEAGLKPSGEPSAIPFRRNPSLRRGGEIRVAYPARDAIGTEPSYLVCKAVLTYRPRWYAFRPLPEKWLEPLGKVTLNLRFIGYG